MRAKLRWIAAALALLLLVASSLFGLWAPADAKLAETRFALDGRAPTGDIVLVDIDAQSLLDVGHWPWPRSVHARLLDQLMDLGAYEVAFDIDFSTHSSSREDAALSQSLERAGGYAYLAAFRQLDSAGREVWNLPIPEFAAHAESALVNVHTLEGGMVWSVPGRSFDPDLGSIAARFAPEKPPVDTIRVDYSIDLNRVVRIPAAAVLYGTVDPELIRDRQVVIGASALELHDLFVVPRFGIIPGPLVQIAAAETIKLDRNLTNLGPWPALLLGALLLILSATMPRLALVRVNAAMIALSIAAEIGALVLLHAHGFATATTPLHVAAAIVLITRLFEERALRRKQLAQQRARLAYLANHDVRTGAMSHPAWLEEVDHRIVAAPIWVLLLRIRRLDQAAAALGSDVAEATIARLYERLGAFAHGPIGRIESDIFAVALGQRLSDAQIENLLALLEDPYEISGHRIVIGLKWGASDAPSATEGLHRARMALAVADNQGSRGTHYAETFDADLQYRQSIDLALRGAVASGELHLVFQTQVDMQTREAIGVEALLRWNNKDHGAVSPGVFVPLAEENGTIIEIGAWVAHEACRRAMESRWPGTVSINVSPVQFQKDDVVAMVASALAATGFPAERLEVEVTESLLAQNGEIVETLQKLRDLGVSIAIDDFGTGYSSLSYLWGLPLDKLKIDQSFVRQLGDSRNASIVEAIVSLGQRLDLTIVVEGVETEAHFSQLSALGCNIAQGFLFGRPGVLREHVIAA